MHVVKQSFNFVVTLYESPLAYELIGSTKVIYGITSMHIKLK